jgi:hypothetical protein
VRDRGRNAEAYHDIGASLETVVIGVAPACCTPPSSCVAVPYEVSMTEAAAMFLNPVGSLATLLSDIHI